MFGRCQHAVAVCDNTSLLGTPHEARNHTSTRRQRDGTTVSYARLSVMTAIDRALCRMDGLRSMDCACLPSGTHLPGRILRSCRAFHLWRSIHHLLAHATIEVEAVIVTPEVPRSD
jgi:hypothetical protein